MKQLTSILLLLFTVSLFAQSPWTQKKGKAYTQISFTSISNYDKLFGNSEIATEREITDNTLQLYGEYGLSGKTTLVASIPLKFVKSGDLVNPSGLPLPITISESKTSLGNIQLGIKHQFYKKDWLISGQLVVEANTGSFENLSGLQTGYNAWSFTPLVLVGRNFNNWYVQAFTGFDIRTNNYSSNYKLGGEVGCKVLDWLWIAGFLDGVLSFKNGDAVLGTNALTGLYVNDQEYAGFGLKLIGEINKSFGANLSVGGAFEARNVAKAPAITFGLYYKF